MNFLYLGDCLDVLRDYVKDETVDLIYIDPPFNSKRNYNVFFDDKEIHSQRIAFEDTWSLKNVGDSLQQLRTAQYDDLYELLKVYQKVAPQVFPYLVMMTLRIVELHRVLKPTGSFYLHCDPTASHYLKTVCDIVFGHRHFQNEIIWAYDTAGRSKSNFNRKHDVIFWYSKNVKSWTFNGTANGVGVEREATNHMRLGLDETGRQFYEKSDKASGKVYRWYLDELKVRNDWWQDIVALDGEPADVILLNALNREEKERLGYPTQKPKTLLERIIQASSNEGDLILDAFCGCGTSIDAAEGLKRRWIGIDISPFALSLIKRRLKDAYKADLNKFEIRGIPTDEKSAIKLWEQNAFAFQDWWITEFEAFSSTFGKKGADKGIDGIALYALPNLDEPLRVAFQVKGGEKVQSKDIDALLGAMVVHQCQLGIFLTRAAPTKPMLDKATTVGYFEIGNLSYPKLQILTLADFFNNMRPKLPSHNVTFKSAVTTGKTQQQSNLW